MENTDSPQNRKADDNELHPNAAYSGSGEMPPSDPGKISQDPSAPGKDKPGNEEELSENNGKSLSEGMDPDKLSSI